LQYGTGRDIATQRARAGELIANQIQDVYGNQSNLLQNLGTNQSNLIGGQASDLINLQNAAALRAQQNAINLGGSMSNLQTGLATNTANQIQGQTLYNQQPFDYQGMYADAFNQASGGADLMDQALNQRQKAAPATTSVPSYINPASFGPYRQDAGGYRMPPGGVMNPSFNMMMPRGASNPFSMNYLGGLV
jgi:hypothetical protein